MKVLMTTAPLPAAFFARAIKAADADADLVEYRADLSEAELAQIEAVVAWRLPHGVAGRLPNLKWVCAVSAGVDKVLVPDLAPHVWVSRIVDPDQADGMAQFVVLMALRHSRDLPAYEAQQRRHEWVRRPTAAVRSRVAVLGTGVMGGAVARLMRQVGFVVEGWNRRSAEPFETVLGRSDIVVCALPLTERTERLFDARALACMPSGSYFINIARGEQVVEADLIDAVQSGHLAGAALDVQRQEPLPPDDPLWNVPGITITPHIAAQSSPETIAMQFVTGLRCVERGEMPPQTIDRSRGY